MYDEKRILAVIPVRGGSKGLPRKNLLNLSGKPLVAWTVEQALNSKYIDRVLVSTDDEELSNTAVRYGADVPFIRPSRLALDDSSVIDVLLHAVEWVESSEQDVFDVIVLLQATSPLREVEDIDKCIELLHQKFAENVFSVCISKNNPYFNMVEKLPEDKIKLVKESNFTTRQSAPKVFSLNGAVYVWSKRVLKGEKKIFLENSQIYLMPKERSIDIDDKMDFAIAELLMKDKFNNEENY